MGTINEIERVKEGSIEHECNINMAKGTLEEIKDYHGNDAVEEIKDNQGKLTVENIEANQDKGTVKEIQANQGKRTVQKNISQLEQGYSGGNTRHSGSNQKVIF
ncbi:hypothetical protein BgiBS90_003026 [Biomphalaria glabrata]|nr:hypothetical protein BgiBS90_003026 [Biomphalaria glabrata]